MITNDVSEDFENVTILNHCLPITCLKLYNEFLLVAEGPTFLVKNTKLDSELKRFQLFTRVQTIQGIEIAEEHCESVEFGFEKSVQDKVVHVIVWAGSEVKIVQLNIQTGNLNTNANTQHCYKFDFLPIAFRCLNQGKQLAILSALNYLFVYDFEDEAKKYVKKVSYHGTRAHLYCGTLSGTSIENIIVFSGTAYREINIWSIAENKSKHVQTLKGHNGVALSLLYYSNLHTLISVSDDRSAIIWKTCNSSLHQDGLNFQLITKFFCPEARIWKSIIAGNVIASVGEGSVIAIHDFEGKLLKSWKGHHGASIYQCAFNPEGNILYTGAYDGSISEWRNCINQYETNRIPLDVNCDGLEVIKQFHKDYPRSIVQYDVFNTIVAMDSGRIIVCNPNRPDSLLFDSPCLRRYSIMALSPAKDMIIVGSLQGDVFNLQVKYGEGFDEFRTIVAERDEYRPWATMIKSGKKIVSTIWVHPFRCLIATLDEIFILEFEYENKVSKVYHHGIVENKEITKELSNDIEVVCGKFIQKFFVHLTAPGISSAVEIDSKYIILGDDDGNINICKYGQENSIQQVKKAHRYGVTSIIQWGKKIITCGRNGIVRVYSFDHENESTPSMMECSNYTMPFEWVDKLFLFGQELLICGFSSTSFVIYCWSEKRMLTEVANCGGGHRSWDLFLSPFDLSMSTFSYIRDKEVYFTRLCLKELMGHTIKSGVHSKTINCAINIGVTEKEFSLFATGSEDGTIRTFFWNNQSQKIIMNNMFNNHISSVRTLAVAEDPSDALKKTFFLFSGGGRSQIIAWRIRRVSPAGSDTTEIEMCGEQSLCDIPKKIKFSIDTRIMDISVIVSSESSTPESFTIICFCACSDGYVRVLSYSPTKKRFYLIAVLTGIEHAIMKVHADFHENYKYIYAVTSNGYFLIWKWNSLLIHCSPTKLPNSKMEYATLEPTFKQRIQNSAIMSLKFIRLKKPGSDELMYVIISTDDTSVAMFQLLHSPEDDFKCEPIWTKSYINHRGAIVSVDCDSNLTNVISCSNDQVISYWNFNGEFIHDSTFAGVTDCQGIVILDNCMLCYGNGISFVSNPCKYF